MNIFQKFWKKKKLRQSLILTILTVIFIIILANNLKTTEQKRSIKLLICKECREPETRAYIDIKTQLCAKCAKKGKMLYSFKCSKCDYEFGVTPIPPNQLEGLSKKEKIAKQIENKKCKNCPSLETYPLVDYKAIKAAAEKRKKEKE